MSSAHGAGLMVAPVLIGAGAAEASARRPRARGGRRSGAALLDRARSGSLLHVAAMIAVMGVVAVLVYDTLGVAVLRKAWINLDGLWAAAFVVAGLLTLFT